jgi:hypothetical protein
MASVEQTIKNQFARRLTKADWPLFKRMAEFYLRRAVYLKTEDCPADSDLKLLVRNSLKRLFIGIGVELLLKAVYLKHGYEINRLQTPGPNAPAFPFTFQQAQGVPVAPDQTYMLNNLIEKLGSVLPAGLGDDLSRGLRIAKVFRNKEGHTVLPTHQFDPSNYRDIEASLTIIYDRAFGENLRARFSVAQGEVGLWKVTRSYPRVQRTT